MSQHRTSPAMRALIGFLEFHSSVYGWDKTMKNLSYALPLIARALANRSGMSESPLPEALRQMGSWFSMYRVGSRLATGPFGLPAEIENLVNHSWYGGWKHPGIKWCVWMQSVMMLGYYPLEHLIWVGSVAPKLVKADLAKASRISCGFWTTWLLIDLLATALRFRELDRIERELSRGRALTLADKEMLSRSRQALRLHLVRVLLFLPNAIHWTLPDNHKYALPPALVELFGLGEGLVGTYSLAMGYSIACPHKV